MRAVVVIPTYNGAENLPNLAQAVLEQPGVTHIVVVDDHSPDGTGVVAEQLKRQLGRLIVLHRPAKLGLGSAYVAGLQQALALEAECAITMDADFSHQPHHIPQLLAASLGHDLVIGSRYIEGGGIGNWQLHRRILSRGANTLARRAAGLRARDCTSGFRCYRAPLLERIDWKALRSSDYAFLIELLFVCQGLGASIAEVPIFFQERRKGASKISRLEIWRAFCTVARLAGRRLQQRALRRPVRAGPVATRG